jgi:hypothetical protein
MRSFPTSRAYGRKFPSVERQPAELQLMFFLHWVPPRASQIWFGVIEPLFTIREAAMKRKLVTLSPQIGHRAKPSETAIWTIAVVDVGATITVIPGCNGDASHFGFLVPN